ncbi:hypothetical protein FRB90_010308 [Tulasnella sp. 427]|nr:hypothetical protein FRB90_010308 [Tulasnella sp. 427]
MASHQTSSSYLRNSVFDAALEIGLVDPSLSNWLDDVPEVAEDKTISAPAFAVPSSSTAHEPWISSPDSELSHSSTANTLTYITSNSSQGSFTQQYASSRHPPPRNETTPRAVLPDKLELKSNTSPSGPVLHSSPFVLPLQPAKRAHTKLLKKVGRGDKKGSGEKDLANSNPEGAPIPSYSFLQHEPTPPPSDHEKESKGFFGRLRDRSRSKSRANRKGQRNSDETEERSGKDARAVITQGEGDAAQRRGRDGQQKDVKRPGGVTVVKVNEGGLPQLQLDPLSNRKSADLLSALSAEFSLVAATAAESVATKDAIAAYYARVIKPGVVVDQQQHSPAPAPTAEIPAVASQPIPRLKSVMDRPHPKVRTSGFWANKDRGIMVPGGGASHASGGRSRVARKASASRRTSVRGAAGVRRVPSHKRKTSALGGNNAKPSAAAESRMSIGGLIDAIREEGAAGAETTDFEEVDTDSDDDTPIGLPYDAQPEERHGASASDSEPVPAIPVIIERRPSTKSTRSSKPALSLTLNNLAPALPGTTPIQRLSPSSPMRSPGSRFRRSTASPSLPSPLKPPPTSPLPPTPTPDNASLAPSVDERPQSGIVTPTAAKAVLAAMPSPRQSDWFEDEDSDGEHGTRTRIADRTPGQSNPNSPSGEYIVPTPTSTVTAFQPPATEFSQPIPRPSVVGRAATTPEARARATASAAMSRTGSTLGVPSPNGMPASPRPGTSPQPTGRVTPSHLRPRPGGNTETVRGVTPPPSTWNPPQSALTRISSMKSLRGREPNGIPQQQQQPPQPLQARSHSRDDSNGSTASGTQRGRTSPFPVRPSGSRDVSPLPSLKRTPSRMSTRQRTERVRSFHAEVGGDFDAEVRGRQSEDSVRSGESEGWATTSSTRSSNESHRTRPRNFNDVSRGEMYMPSPSPMTPARPGVYSRGPSPLPPTLPLNPSPHRPGSRIASPPLVGRPQHPALRPSASFTINRPQQTYATTLAPSSSLRFDRSPRATGIPAKSVYSTVEDVSDDDFKGLDLDDDDEDEDEEDRPGSGKGFDVIAARLGGPASKSAKLLERIAVDDAEVALPPKGRGNGFARPPAPSMLSVPQRPMTGPNSPNLSPRTPRVYTPTPTSAGGARWI